MTRTTPATVWIDGDPLMEAIAAAVWEQCNTEPGSSVVDDDPRNIAAVAATAARQTLGATEQQPAAYPAEVSFIGEIEESDGFWMYLTADRGRAAVEKRIASRQKQFPTWADGRPVRCRIVRKTTTYTVEPTP